MEATSSAMLLLISQSEHDSFSMLVPTRKKQKHTQIWAFKEILNLVCVCVCLPWCLFHLMSWSMLQSGDMSSKVFENFTTCVRDTYHHKLAEMAQQSALCTGKASRSYWICEKVRKSRRSDR